MKKLIYLLFILFYSINLFSQTTIPMRKESGVYYIPCKINNLPMEFIFDTGASNVSISLSAAIYMFENGYLNKNDIGEKIYFSIANGDIAEGTNINIRELSIAGIKLFNVEASIVHELKAPLLLGNSVISRLGNISLNGHLLTIHNNSSTISSFEDINVNKPNTVTLSRKEISEKANFELIEANKAMDAKQFTEAGTKFLNVYNLVKVLGNKEDIYRYQAAICFYNANDYDKSLAITKELAANGFTGKSANQIKDYNRDMYVLALNGLYKAKKYDAIVEEATAKYPKDTDINNLATGIYQVTGNVYKLKQRIEESIKFEPKNPINYYNLGVILLEEDMYIEEAKGMFKKAIELNPKYYEAYNNLVLLILRPDKKIVETMNNNLGNSLDEKYIYKLNLEKRKQIFIEALPFLEIMHKIQPENEQIIKNLIRTYKTLGENKKLKKFK